MALEFSGRADFARADGVRCYATADGQAVTILVTTQALETHFGLIGHGQDIGPNALAAFNRNRPAIERVASEKYKGGSYLVLKADDFSGGGGMSIDNDL